MSRPRDDSLQFYEYLCQKIGSEEDVKARRITSIVCDIGNGRSKQIRSGSSGEGLNLKGSDVDLMMIYSKCVVYEYYSEIPVQNKKIPLVMDPEDTQPCFTKLRIVRGRSSSYLGEIVLHADHKGVVLSSKMFKQIKFDFYSKIIPNITKIHGPCLSDTLDLFDIAYCLKCDKWISQSEAWIKRSREKWPSSDLISKIISCGVLNRMCNLLKISYQQGIRCFSATKTLMDYPKYSGEINQPLCCNARLVNEINHAFSCGIYAVEENIYMLLSTLLNYSRSGMSRDIFTFFVSRAHQIAPQCSQIHQGSNKQKYLKLKNIISHLLIGVHTDAVSGWMMLASFFYETKNYLASLSILNHGLLKCTDEKVQLEPSMFQGSLNFNQIYALNMIKNETLMTSLKTLTMNLLFFAARSLIIPTELQLDVQKKSYWIHPKPFAHFLGFLCCYHLKDSASCNHFIRQLFHDADTIFTKQESDSVCKCHILICIGIAMHMFGETSRAKGWLHIASVLDKYNLTSAKIRLSKINLHD
ncbi:unnamed protein product [Mytilus coruscus]|uniref:Mab-21-like HhH/H2TH-like domain-containing protein n=1 Tax=Mytilus coruscus TaxID=42192 RepID=A0A6J8EPZ6_MYTCO|nr:unnamed protein product [Mytilus coruscus]